MDTDVQDFKTALHQRLLEILNEKIATIEKEISGLRDDQRRDTKSSAGDKFETSRAMIQLEIDRLNRSLALVKQDLSKAERLDTSPHDRIHEGSLIKTDQAIYYLSVGLGALDMDETKILFISKQAPKGKLLHGKMAGQTFSFNGLDEVVMQVG